MDWLTLTELESDSGEFDASVWTTPEIDRFCTSSDWSIPAAKNVMPEAKPFITRSGGGYVAMMCVPIAGGLRAAVPLEVGWGLAAPFAGPRAEPLVQTLAQMWSERRDDVDALILSGISLKSQWMSQIMFEFDPRYRIGVGASCVRRIASLESGIDGFLSRRSSRFRRNLRRAVRRGRAAELTYDVPQADACPKTIFKRILSIEAQSWKGLAGEGFDTGPGASFYEEIISRLSARSGLRIIFAQHNDEDVGFIFGAVTQGQYRGLQLSFIRGLENLEVGNLLQWEMIGRLVQEQVATYDLGTDMPYKQRWAEQALETHMIAVMTHH